MAGIRLTANPFAPATGCPGASWWGVRAGILPREGHCDGVSQPAEKKVSDGRDREHNRLLIRGKEFIL